MLFSIPTAALWETGVTNAHRLIILLPWQKEKDVLGGRLMCLLFNVLLSLDVAMLICHVQNEDRKSINPTSRNYLYLANSEEWCIDFLKYFVMANYFNFKIWTVLMQCSLPSSYWKISVKHERVKSQRIRARVAANCLPCVFSNALTPCFPLQHTRRQSLVHRYTHTHTHTLKCKANV